MVVKRLQMILSAGLSRVPSEGDGARAIDGGEAADTATERASAANQGFMLAS